MRLSRLASLGLLFSASALVSACGGGNGSMQSSGTSTGTGGSTDSFMPASHSPAPQVVKGSGSVLASPKFVPVFFSNDDATTEGKIQDFIGKLGSSAYFKAATSEYGVGAATMGPVVKLTEAADAMIDGSTIPTWLAGKLDGKDPLWPAPDANTVYVLHYPAGTTITQSVQGQTITSCAMPGFGGYHESTALASGTQVAYAVVPRCSGFGPLMGLDALTGAESHELIEAATDPYPPTSPLQDTGGFSSIDTLDFFWELALGGGEIGDMCAQNPGAFVKDASLGYTVQRIWSNKSAAGSHDPCVPVPQGEVYFNAAPVVTATSVGVNGITVPVGQTKTVEVDLFSDAPTSGPFTVKALDLAELLGQSPTLSFSWDKTTGQNGDKLKLSITAKSTGQIEGMPVGAALFLIISKLGTQENLWVGFVSNM